MNNPLLIFDLGNVLVHVDFQKTLAAWSSFSGYSPEEIIRRFDMNGQIHLDFERGDITPDRFRQAVSDALNINMSERQFQQSWNAMVEDVYPGVIEMVDSLKSKGIRLAILSNTNRVHEEFFMKKYARLLSRFDGIFLSHKLRYRKPETAVFEAVMKKFHVQPEFCYFLDDKLENIAGAEKTGIRSKHVRTLEEIKAAVIEWKLL